MGISTWSNLSYSRLPYIIDTGHLCVTDACSHHIYRVYIAHYQKETEVQSCWTSTHITLHMLRTSGGNKQHSEHPRRWSSKICELSVRFIHVPTKTSKKHMSNEKNKGLFRVCRGWNPTQLYWGLFHKPTTFSDPYYPTNMKSQATFFFVVAIRVPTLGDRVDNWAMNL